MTENEGVSDMANTNALENLKAAKKERKIHSQVKQRNKKAVDDQVLEKYINASPVLRVSIWHVFSYLYL